MLGNRSFWRILLAFVGLLTAHASESVDYASSVQPILQEYCYECHGPDARKGGLRLSNKSDALMGGDSGKPLVAAHNPNASPMLERILSKDPAVRMPPKGDPLSETEVAIIRSWIDGGAPWGGADEQDVAPVAHDHWAFNPPTQAPVPAVSDPAWVRNPIDAYVLARLEKEGLTPSPEADRYTLVRRLYLDLIGLPPSPEEVMAFVHDTSPDAYEGLVDRLLASPHYGERRALGWLDAARYADTNGYEKDRRRSIWPYRDWVIQAFNDDMPFDRFTIEQLAGDLLPNPTLQQRIATGFHRNTLINEEGGVDVEEFRYEANVDKVKTTSTVFLGLTMACAQCHTHKFDPITQREYYQFYAFFNNTDDVDIEVPDPEIAAKRAEIESEIEARKASLEEQFPIDAMQKEWVTANHENVTASNGTSISVVSDGVVQTSGESPDTDVYRLEATLPEGSYTAFRIEALTGPALPGNGPGRSEGGNFVLSEFNVELLANNEPTPVSLEKAEADFSQAGFDVSNAIDGKDDTGWAIGGADGGSNVNRSAVFRIKNPKAMDSPARVAFTIKQLHGGGHTIGRFRITAERQFYPPSELSDSDRRDQFFSRQFAAWEADIVSRSVQWTPLRSIEAVSKNHATFVNLDDDSILVKGDCPNVDEYTVSFRTELEGITAFRIEVLPHPSLPNGGPGRGVIMSPGGDFLLSEVTATVAPWFNGNAVEPVGLQNPTHSFAASGRGIELALDGKLDSGWSVKDREGEPHAAVFEFERPVGFHGGSLLTLKLDQYYVHTHTIGRFRISVTTSPAPVRASGVPANIETIVLKPAASRTQQESANLKNYYLGVAPELLEKHREIKSLRASMPKQPTTMVLEEREDPRITHIHHRGEFLSPREPVTPAVPALLPPLPEHAPPNRLALAKWLVSPGNPLTARVTVNRFWQEIFGAGLVNTPEDFGVRSSAPSHPELLDWLAVEFMRRGWGVKDLLRMIVTSSTYRQSSDVTPDVLAVDPVNRLLARGPRFRMDAEIVRDIALASSGLLNEQIGGPSIFPPLPEGVLSAVYGGEGWTPSEGDTRYRRGMYIHIKRSLPYPALTVFDAPARQDVCVARIRSNTPLQALTMLNDQTIMDSARAMARRLLTSEISNDSDRLRHAFMMCVARPPDSQEEEWLKSFLERQTFRLKDAGTAPETIAYSDGDDMDPSMDAHQAAVWTLLCRALLNLDETITKG